MEPLDVGGEGDCFFGAVSHQLYGDSSHHLHIREVDVQYLSDNLKVLLKYDTTIQYNTS